MKTVIYKGKKKQGAYLYLIEEDDFSQIPEQLLSAMGELELVMTLELTSKRKLAQADIEQVIKALKKDGFYLQMEKESEVLPLADKKPKSNAIPTLL